MCVCATQVKLASQYKSALPALILACVPKRLTFEVASHQRGLDAAHTLE